MGTAGPVTDDEAAVAVALVGPVAANEERPGDGEGAAAGNGSECSPVVPWSCDDTDEATS